MTEQLPIPERLTDDQKIELGIRFAELNCTVIPDSTARRVAMAYHGGQDSALYALGSSGAINVEAVCLELEAELSPEDAEDMEHDRVIGALIDYAASKGTRSPVPMWSRTTDDYLPAIVHTDTELEPRGAYIGEYDSKRDVASDLLMRTGVYRAIHRIIEAVGESLGDYINVDEEGYTRDIHKDVQFMPLPNGRIDAYYR